MGEPADQHLCEEVLSNTAVHGHMARCNVESQHMCLTVHLQVTEAILLSRWQAHPQHLRKAGHPAVACCLLNNAQQA